MMDREIQPGMPVVSSDGISLGTVAEVDSDGFAISGGSVVHGAHRVSGMDISGVFAGEVYLRKRAADVAAMGGGVEAPQPNM